MRTTPPPVAILLLLSRLTHAQNTTNINLDASPLTVSYTCSHTGNSSTHQWKICTQPDGWGSMFYCPAYSPYNEDELSQVGWGGIGQPTPMMPCFSCPVDSTCEEVVRDTLTENGIAQDQNVTLMGTNIWNEATQYCRDLCESNKEGELCNQENQCTPGALFCDYDADDTEFTRGTCRSCPTNPDECFEDGFAATVKGQHNCRDCRLYCMNAGVSELWIDGENEDSLVPSQPINWAIQFSRQVASGPLHDCSMLILDPKSTCDGAQGKMCIVHFNQEFALTWQVSNQAEKSGCVGVIAFRNKDPGSPIGHSNDELLIPYVYISNEDGLNLVNNKIGHMAIVQFESYGAGCYPVWEQNKCSAKWPCEAGSYCRFSSVPVGDGDLLSEGACEKCPSNDDGKPDPMACYFDNRKSVSETVERISTTTVQKVQSCAASCNAELTSQECKFCNSPVTAFEFGVENKEDQCILCPMYDVQYPDRVVPLFGPNVKCWQLETFFQRLPVHKDSRNCQLAQSMNYICGCEGTGYAGASTQTKQSALVWMPRIAAIFSMLGSLFIIADTQTTRTKRAKLINKIMCSMSIFDFIGSFALSLTSLPTPEQDYIYGAKGTDATCKAQGFFIQMGTVASLIGVSLAVYYHLTIKKGWNEYKMQKLRVIYWLLIPPIAIGLIFAGAGIPFYDNVIVWCNNSARWWPEIPVIIAILAVTAIMADVWYSVYKKESATSKYTGGSKKLSKMVFKQALFFTGSFYLAWIPYLVLQFMWSSGTGYAHYGLILAAATMMPLQGLYNFYVYARPRYFSSKKGQSIFSSISSRWQTWRDYTSTNFSSVGKTTTTQLQPSTVETTTTAVLGQMDSQIGAYEDPKVVQFGAPDEDPKVVQFGAPDEEPKIVQFGAPDEPDIVPDATDSTQDGDEEENARYDMILAG